MNTTTRIVERPGVANGEPVPVEVVRRYSVETTITSIVDYLLQTWIAMLALGALHLHHPAVPAVSFSDAALGAIVINAVAVISSPMLRTWRRPKGR